MPPVCRGSGGSGGGGQVEQGRQRPDPVEQLGDRAGAVEQGEGGRPVAVQAGQHLQPEQAGHHAVGDLAGRQQRSQRRGGEHVPHRRLRERTPRGQAGADPLAEARHRVRPADHLHQHGDVARVEVGLEDRAGGVDELAQRPGPVKQLAVGGHPPGADLLERRHQQVGDRAEVVEDQRLVASGLGRDPPGAGGRESGLAQGGDGGVDKRGPGVTHGDPLGDEVLSDRFKRSLKIEDTTRPGGREARVRADSRGRSRRTRLTPALALGGAGGGRRWGRPLRHAQAAPTRQSHGNRAVGRGQFWTSSSMASAVVSRRAMVWPRWLSSFAKPDLAIAPMRNDRVALIGEIRGLDRATY